MRKLWRAIKEGIVERVRNVTLRDQTYIRHISAQETYTQMSQKLQKAVDFMHSMEAAMMEKRVVAVEFKCAKNCRRCAMFKKHQAVC